MLKIKLTPTGKKHEIHYRIVVMEENSKLTSIATDVIGHYHPLTKELTLDNNAYQKWVQKGAQPTQRVLKLFRRNTASQ